MDIELSAEEKAFRDEVRTFLAENLTDRIREGAEASPTVFVEPEIGQDWNEALNKQGWDVYSIEIEPVSQIASF